MAELRRKTLNNQSINNKRIKNVVTLRVFYFGRTSDGYIIITRDVKQYWGTRLSLGHRV